MSDLGGLRTVPALLLTAVILAGLLVVTGVSAAVFNTLSMRYQDRLSGAGDIAVFFALACGVGIVACLITSAGLKNKHWDETCHRDGGVLAPSGDCVKPNSIIDVP